MMMPSEFRPEMVVFHSETGGYEQRCSIIEIDDNLSSMGRQQFSSSSSQPIGQNKRKVQAFHEDSSGQHNQSLEQQSNQQQEMMWLYGEESEDQSKKSRKRIAVEKRISCKPMSIEEELELPNIPARTGIDDEEFENIIAEIELGEANRALNLKNVKETTTIGQYNQAIQDDVLHYPLNYIPFSSNQHQINNYGRELETEAATATGMQYQQNQLLLQQQLQLQQQQNQYSSQFHPSQMNDYHSRQSPTQNDYNNNLPRVAANPLLGHTSNEHLFQFDLALRQQQQQQLQQYQQYVSMQQQLQQSKCTHNSKSPRQQCEEQKFSTVQQECTSGYGSEQNQFLQQELNSFFLNNNNNFNGNPMQVNMNSLQQQLQAQYLHNTYSSNYIQQKQPQQSLNYSPFSSAPASHRSLLPNQNQFQQQQWNSGIETDISSDRFRLPSDHSSQIPQTQTQQQQQQQQGQVYAPTKFTQFFLGSNNNSTNNNITRNNQINSTNMSELSTISPRGNPQKSISPSPRADYNMPSTLYGGDQSMQQYKQQQQSPQNQLKMATHQTTVLKPYQSYMTTSTSLNSATTPSSTSNLNYLPQQVSSKQQVQSGMANQSEPSQQVGQLSYRKQGVQQQQKDMASFNKTEQSMITPKAQQLSSSSQQQQQATSPLNLNQVKNRSNNKIGNGQQQQSTAQLFQKARLIEGIKANKQTNANQASASFFAIMDKHIKKRVQNQFNIGNGSPNATERNCGSISQDLPKEPVSPLRFNLNIQTAKQQRAKGSPSPANAPAVLPTQLPEQTYSSNEDQSRKSYFQAGGLQSKEIAHSSNSVMVNSSPSSCLSSVQSVSFYERVQQQQQQMKQQQQQTTKDKTQEQAQTSNYSTQSSNSPNKKKNLYEMASQWMSSRDLKAQTNSINSHKNMDGSREGKRCMNSNNCNPDMKATATATQIATASSNRIAQADHKKSYQQQLSQRGELHKTANDLVRTFDGLQHQKNMNSNNSLNINGKPIPQINKNTFKLLVNHQNNSNNNNKKNNPQNESQLQRNNNATNMQVNTNSNCVTITNNNGQIQNVARLPYHNLSPRNVLNKDTQQRTSEGSVGDKENGMRNLNRKQQHQQPESGDSKERYYTAENLKKSFEMRQNFISQQQLQQQNQLLLLQQQQYSHHSSLHQQQSSSTLSAAQSIVAGNLSQTNGASLKNLSQLSLHDRSKVWMQYKQDKQEGYAKQLRQLESMQCPFKPRLQSQEKRSDSNSRSPTPTKQSLSSCSKDVIAKSAAQSYVKQFQSKIERNGQIALQQQQLQQVQQQQQQQKEQQQSQHIQQDLR